MLRRRIHDDMVQAKGDCQTLYFGVKGSVSGNGHIHIRAKRLITVTAMQINQVVCLIDDLGGEQVSDALADTALGIARVHAIQIFTVYRAVVDSTAQK